MEYDLKITGGTLVDGTGAPPRLADVAVRGGRVVAIGDCPGAAARTLDASGAIVTPGFVDIHCHYDGQVSWDETLSPSAAHGVTTCVIGNCGVGFAPVHERDRARLIALMEGVEDIPGSALAEGLQWSWESFPEYLDAIAAKPRSIDVLAQVPHDALRVFVMGDRAVAHGVATDEDIDRMRALVREALLAGAAGFSTGRSDNHVSVTGEATPASESSARELAGIAKAFEGLSHGVVQAVSDFDMPKGPDRFEAEFDVLERMDGPEHMRRMGQRLRDGRVLAGTIVQVISGQQVVLDTSDGQRHIIPWDQVADLRYAAPTAPATPIAAGPGPSAPVSSDPRYTCRGPATHHSDGRKKSPSRASARQSRRSSDRYA